MVIMNPYHVVRADCFEQSCAKRLIDLAILGPVFFVISGVGGKIMKKRPDSFVAKALIEIFKVGSGKKNRIAGEFRQSPGSDQLLGCSANRASWPADPEIIGCHALRTRRRE